MNVPHIYIVSGGKGLLGEHVVKTLLVQFRDFNIPTSIESNIISKNDAHRVVLKAKKNNGIILHTMVNKNMRNILTGYCKEYNIVHFDILGPLSDFLTDALGVEPIQEPGLFRKINQD